MADYGFIVTNIDDVVSIDSDFVNYSTSDNATKSIVSGINLITYPSTTAAPLLLMRPTTAYMSWYGYRRSGSYYTGFYVAASGTGTLNYRIATPTVPTLPANAYGIAVYDSSGTLVFSSDTTHPRLISSGKPTYPGMHDSAETTYIVEDTDNNYFICTPTRCAINHSSGTSQVYTAGFKRKTTTQVGFKQVYAYSTSINYSGSFTASLQMSGGYATFCELGGNF